MTEIDITDGISEGINTSNEWEIQEEGGSQPSASKVYKSRNKMEAFHSNHKTTEPSDYNMSQSKPKKNTSVDQKRSLVIDNPEGIFGSFDRNSRNIRPSLDYESLQMPRFTNISARSYRNPVPQNLIKDANRRQMVKNKVENYNKHPSKGLLQSRKLSSKKINHINSRFEYYEQKKNYKINDKRTQLQQKLDREAKEVITKDNVHIKYKQSFKGAKR